MGDWSGFLRALAAFVGEVEDYNDVIAAALIVLCVVAVVVLRSKTRKAQVNVFYCFAACLVVVLIIGHYGQQPTPKPGPLPLPPIPRPQPDTPAEATPTCADYIPIKELGWRGGHKTKFCRARGWNAGNFNPWGKYKDGGFCMKGDVKACRAQIMENTK